jgi:predicted lipoprotein with Yx(FWY)xxD motif
MKRTYLLLACALAVAVSCTSVAAAAGGTQAAHSTRAATVALRHTSLGTILVSSSGLTLYVFTRDHSNQNSCVRVSGCASAWPALQSSGAPSAGSGVQASLLSTTRLSGAVKQVTYAGHPLYLFSSEDRPGGTGYVGQQSFGGAWYAINAAGHEVK